MYLEQVGIIVEDYDEAIEFFVEKLDFEFVKDSLARTMADPEAMGRDPTAEGAYGAAPSAGRR